MSDLKLSKKDDGGSFDIALSSIITLQLDENPTTGFVWTFDMPESSVLDVKGSDFTLPQDAGLGGGGKRTFTLKPKVSGVADIRLKLWREWEGDESVIDRFSFKLNIQK